MRRISILLSNCILMFLIFAASPWVQAEPLSKSVVREPKEYVGRSPMDVRRSVIVQPASTPDILKLKMRVVGTIPIPPPSETTWYCWVWAFDTDMNANTGTPDQNRDIGAERWILVGDTARTESTCAPTPTPIGISLWLYDWTTTPYTYTRLSDSDVTVGILLKVTA